ncbi:MAG: CopG family transcriptional regulator [Halococcoides sp.]
MPTRFTVVCEDDRAERIATLARRHDLTEEGVLRQLLDLGLEAVDEEVSSESAIER